jgi:hypothetical protein
MYTTKIKQLCIYRGVNVNRVLVIASKCSESPVHLFIYKNFKQKRHPLQDGVNIISWELIILHPITMKM